MNRVLYAGRLPHLDILRGFAILFIVLFHFHTPYFCNGYYGVEIFLVISGFLLLNSHIRKGAPDFLDFVRRKIFRIYPSLAVCVLLTAAAALLLIPDSRELLDCYRTAGYALLGRSNFFLDHNHDYFAPNAIFNPLLHTWYIAVTIQVYLLYIIIASATKRLPSRLKGALLVLLAVLSLCDAYGLRFFPLSLLHHWDAASSYYSVLSRLWEVIAGGLVFLLPNIPQTRLRKTVSYLTLLGLLILLGIPANCGYSLAPIVVLLTVCFIRYAEFSDYSACISAPLSQLGLCSFSVYLIHYPIIIFFNNAVYRQMGALSYILCFCFCLAAGYAMMKLIEKRSFSLPCILISTGITFGLCALLVKKEEWLMIIPNRLAAHPEYPASQEEVPAEYYTHLNQKNVFMDRGLVRILYDTRDSGYINLLLPMGNSRAEASFVLIGDSNAQHLYAGMDAVLKETPVSGLFLCARLYPFTGCTNADGTCDEAKVRDFLAWIEHQPKLRTVIIGQLWDKRLGEDFISWESGERIHSQAANEAALIRFCKELQQRGKQVVLVAPVPQLPSGKTLKPLAYKRIAALKHDRIPDGVFRISQASYKVKNQAIFSLFRRLEEAGIARILWTEDAAFAELGYYDAIEPNSGEVMLNDAHHLSPAGSIRLMFGLKERLSDLLTTMSGK